MNDALVTRSVLKAFGDRSKLLFCPASSINDSSEDHSIALINTNIKFSENWNISLNLSGLTKTGDIINLIFEANNDQNISGQGFSQTTDIKSVVLFDNSSRLSVLVYLNQSYYKQVNVTISDLESKNVNCVENISLIDSTPEDINLYFAFGFDPIEGEEVVGSLLYPEGFFDFALLKDSDGNKTWYSSLPETSKVFSKIYQAAEAFKLAEPINIIVSGRGHNVSSAHTSLDSNVDLQVNINVVDPELEVDENSRYYSFLIKDGLITDLSSELQQYPNASASQYGLVKLGGEIGDRTNYYPVKLHNGNIYTYIPTGGGYADYDIHHMDLNDVNADNYSNLIILHIGNTSANFTNGYFYKSIIDYLRYAKITSDIAYQDAHFDLGSNFNSDDFLIAFLELNNGKWTSPNNSFIDFGTFPMSLDIRPIIATPSGTDTPRLVSVMYILKDARVATYLMASPNSLNQLNIEYDEYGILSHDTAIMATLTIEQSTNKWVRINVQPENGIDCIDNTFIDNLN